MTEVTITRADAVLRGTASGSGPTALLLHAGGEERGVWEPIARALGQREDRPTEPAGPPSQLAGLSGQPAGPRGRPTGADASRCQSSPPRPLRTVAYDLRGHGESSGQATRLGPIAEDVTAMIREEQAPVVVVGASLGGLAAIAALADPRTAQAVAGLILVDVLPNPDPERVRAWLDERGLRNHHNALVEDILDQGPELLAIATNLKLPILLVRAGPTSPLTDDQVNHFHASNPTVTVTQVPGAGHLIARDAPDKLARIIADRAAIWLTTTQPVPAGPSAGDRHTETTAEPR